MYLLVLYTHLLIHAEIYIYILDTYRRNDNRRTQKDRHMNEGRMIKTQEGTKQEEDFFINIYTSQFYCKGSKGLFNGLHVRGCWRPNINFIFWPHCYDRHVVSFLFSWCWGQLHRGFPRAPSVRCGFPYHIWSLAVWNSTGNWKTKWTYLRPEISIVPCHVGPAYLTIGHYWLAKELACLNSRQVGGYPCVVMFKAMDCRIVVRKFILQSRYYVHIRANTLGKGMNPVILPAMG